MSSDDSAYGVGTLLSQQIVEEAIYALAAEVGVEGKADLLSKARKGADEPDGYLNLCRKEEPSFNARYAFQVNLPGRGSSRAQLLLPRLGQNAQKPEPPLLVTTQLTPVQLQRCVESKVQCIDAAGNAYLFGPGYLIRSSGKRLPSDHPLLRIHTPPVSLATAAGLRVLYVLLTLDRSRTKRLDISYREIAERAGVALGTVSRVADEMEKQGLLLREDGRLRRLLAVNRLTDLWLANYPQKLRPQLKSLRFAGHLPDKWWEQLDLRPYDALWGGETAYWLLMNAMPPLQHTIYVVSEKRASLTRGLVERFRLRPDPAGSLEILDRFSLPHAGRVIGDPIYEHLKAPCVPEMLICADLMLINDARAQGAATDMLWRLRAAD